LGLEVLERHTRRASLHPLMTVPNAEDGAARLPGAWFAVAGDALATEVVVELGGRWFTVADHDRATYHAAASVASNGTVALLGMVDRLAGLVGVPLEAFFDLVRTSVDNVERLGAVVALTGPVARGDRATVERHRRALPADELTAYDALVELAERLVQRRG
jgi:predicted short-subunit dehydrogenase-like oxidoreductase (DUF2520 family)